MDEVITKDAKVKFEPETKDAEVQYDHSIEVGIIMTQWNNCLFCS